MKIYSQMRRHPFAGWFSIGGVVVGRTRVSLALTRRLCGFVRDDTSSWAVFFLGVRVHVRLLLAVIAATLCGSVSAQERSAWVLRVIVGYGAGYRVEDGSGNEIESGLSSFEVIRSALGKSPYGARLEYFAETGSGLEPSGPFGPAATGSNSLMTDNRKNITQPADWWAAWKEAADAEGLSLSDWIGRQCNAALGKKAKRLSKRAPAHRPKNLPKKD